MRPNLRAEELDLHNNYVCVIETLYLQITSHVLSRPPTQVRATLTALLDRCGHLSTRLSASRWSPLESVSHVAGRSVLLAVPQHLPTACWNIHSLHFGVKTPPRDPRAPAQPPLPSSPATVPFRSTVNSPNLFLPQDLYMCFLFLLEHSSSVSPFSPLP